MPDKKTEENTASRATDEGHIFAVAVDIIGMNENKFWDSTYALVQNLSGTLWRVNKIMFFNKVEREIGSGGSPGGVKFIRDIMARQ